MPTHSKTNKNNGGFIKDNKQSIKTAYFYTSDHVKLSYKYFEKKCSAEPKCRTYTKRPSVILIHSFGYDSNYWICLFKKLCCSANVYSLDIVGTGNSDKPADLSRYVVERLVTDIYEFMEEININKSYFVGHTFGGLLALNFAAFYPSKVIKIAVSSTSPRFSQLPGYDSSISIQVIDLFNKAFSTSNLAELKETATSLTNMIDPINCDDKKFLVKQYISTLSEYKIYMKAIRNIDIRPILNQITCPVLIMAGTLDPISKLSASKILRDGIFNSTLVEFFGQGNNFPIFSTGLYNKHIINFFFVKYNPCCDFLNQIKDNTSQCAQCAQCAQYACICICNCSAHKSSSKAKPKNSLLNQ
ncbi:MAG: alpha/beta hydrolase [Satyrvirus sp.]|uniref:Alpha/beta hydrolase n=1 Tax=Satyrvirus sp. TaxID=2487771 RepID=A0A3G5ACN8_9VIRU|nr:MAG: alpha/beta hydrolase [Satyrvirus sp.]